MFPRRLSLLIIPFYIKRSLSNLVIDSFYRNFNSQSVLSCVCASDWWLLISSKNGIVYDFSRHAHPRSPHMPLTHPLPCGNVPSDVPNSPLLTLTLVPYTPRILTFMYSQPFILLFHCYDSQAAITFIILLFCTYVLYIALFILMLSHSLLTLFL